MINFDSKEYYGFADLVRIVELLRAPGGCPWDREQTHESIRRNLIEEACEACEAIDNHSNGHLCEELGDVLLQVVFHADIAKGEGAFSIDDVSDRICKKLIHRHPHVFGGDDSNANQGSGTEAKSELSSGEVLLNWDQIKRAEKNQQTHTAAMQSVARSLPALWRAEKIQDKAKKAGFDWPDISGALDKLSEEVDELVNENSAEELGDVLFSAVNVARFLGVDPEEALNRASDKFISRFSHVEAASGENLEKMSLSQLDRLWDEAKGLSNR